MWAPVGLRSEVIEKNAVAIGGIQITSAHLREPAYAAWCNGVQPSLFLDLITAANDSDLEGTAVSKK